jgi:hypothetical protein
MNNFSLVAANRVTHLKVVVMALFFATASRFVRRGCALR